jgi:hypothetical protein
MAPCWPGAEVGCQDLWCSGQLLTAPAIRSMQSSPPQAVPSTHLLEGLPELAARSHAQLLGDVGGHLEQ